MTRLCDRMKLVFKVGAVIIFLLSFSLRLTADVFLAQGNISGYVSNYYGVAISGAIVGIENGPVTTSGPDGFYLLEGILAGEQNVGCGKTGYNTVWTIITVVSSDTVFHNFSLTQPAMFINPLVIDATINPGEFFTSPINILNNGTGILNWQANINYYSAPMVYCQYSIALCDTWGDGWNGSSIDVLVNDSIVLDNITLNSGSGPLIFYFSVNPGDQITTDFNPGSFLTEPYYYIYNGSGEQVWFSPAGNNGPPDILSGQLYASCDEGSWLTLDYYNGELPPFGGLDNVPAHLDASGTNSGESYSADIVFTSSPFVGAVTIPVTMNITGNELIAPENLQTELIDPVTGKIKLSWQWEGDVFQFFLIRRDGSIIATTTSQSYVDVLTDHGNFCYTVQAIYTEGPSSPEGPACTEWPNPSLMVDPDDVEGWVWSGYTVDVYTTISNLGEGTLAYSFPEYAALDLINDPVYSAGRGAGGPDEFGYVWIDSDEPGGPEFEYIDISTTGSPVFGLQDDNIVGPYNIGFEFYFYGETKTEFWVNSNGCIGFTSNKITLGNTSLPTNSSIYNDFIAWMWDDLVFKTGTSQVFYQSYKDKLIIQFKNYERQYQSNLPINAEVVIFENGKILLLYDGFAQGLTLNSCTVGLQSSSPGVGLQVSFNSNYLHNDLAVFMRVPGDFIIDVDPSYGDIPQNSSEVIKITYASKEYIPGPYTQELLLESNDLEHPESIIDNTMHVYLPAIFSGIVYDHDDEDPLNGVLVTAGPYQATTGEDGTYTLYVDEGSYDLVFEKLGYTTVTVEDTIALKDEVTPVSMGLWDNTYAPAFVNAEIINDGTLSLSWGLPQGPYEIILDDGEADDFFVYANAGSWHAVKFTPAGYPATVIGGSFYVGDGSFPGPFLGTDFGVAVFDDDGTNGLPGTMLDSNGVTVNNSGWVSLDWLNAVIEDGSFYLAMYQSGDVPHAAPIGIDSDNPTHFKSYTRFQTSNWNLSPLQDFMIRAWINGPGNYAIPVQQSKEFKSVPRIPSNWEKYAMTLSGSMPEIHSGFENNEQKLGNIPGNGSRDVLSYRVAAYTDFDLDDPLAGGNFIELASTESLSYTDNTFAARPPGWYAFAVKALYSSGIYSEYTISNIVGHLIDFEVNFNITLTTGLEAGQVEVIIEGLDYPYETHTAMTSPNGTAIFAGIWKGHYNVKVYKVGYEPYLLDGVNIYEDKTFDIILLEKKYAPACLTVDPLSLIATWCEPKMTALNEGFEGEEFPPADWQVQSADPDNGWFRSKNASSQGFQIPPWDSYFAVVNNDLAGSENNGCCDYLITPMLDLRESEGYALYFDSFYNGEYGQRAFIEYSLDEGETWNVLYQLPPVDSAWTNIELDLSPFSGPEGPPGLWLTFHSDAGPSWASGWAVDNVTVQVPEPAAAYLDFLVFLDNAYVGTTAETTWDLAPLNYGQIYTFSVAARYSSGLSAKDHFTFESKYLFPPQNLTGQAPDNASILAWDPPASFIPVNLLGYNIYRDNSFLFYQSHVGGWQEQQYTDQDLDPGIYAYTVTGVYDLEPYGHPGETGESMKEGPEIVTVDYCTPMDFVETWDIGTFDLNSWTSNGPNWLVNGQSGNPKPAAEFSWEPIQTDYEITLESYPICAAGITEGRIWLDFDLALTVVQATGQEFLDVQVWNWESREWTTVSSYSNSAGTYDWTRQRIDIRSMAIGKIFKIRFKAYGTFSPDIRGWFIDNIHIYRTCPAPEDLAIDPFYYEGIKLIWEFPEKGNEESENGNRDLAGYLVYRSVNNGNFELLTENVTVMPYIDPDSNLSVGKIYCYKVSAVYQSSTDQCESLPSNEVCAVWTGVNVDPATSGSMVKIYPNPADQQVLVSASSEIKQIAIYNTLGLLVFKAHPGTWRYEINTSGIPAGAYIIRAETVMGVETSLLTIKR